MLSTLTLDEFLEAAKSAKRVAVYQEISADRLTPVGIVESLATEMQDGTILESGLRHEDAGRYSLIAFDAIAQLSVQNKMVSQRVGSETTFKQTHPFTALRQLLAQMCCIDKHAGDLNHGAVGFITYDAIRLFESIPDRHVAQNPMPDMLFNFYRTTLRFDHLQQKLLISIAVETGENLSKIYQDTQEKIAALITKITTFSQQSITATVQAQPDMPVSTDINDEQFMQLVESAKQYIVKGDAFQIVLSRRFTKRYTVNPFDIYRALRQVSPAPYMFYLPIPNGVVIGASPEKLIQVRNQQVEVNPIAGTRQRTPQSGDEQIAAELLNDKKELAEHIMLVDLARNDLGMVCKPGSVKVKELLQIKHFSHVSHITSVVTGQLQDNRDALDALAAVFPAGTLSGAPKIRAMQLIDELETSKRGIYGGAICRLDYRGNLDSCIAIRLALLADGVATVRAGAGIVYDSDPQSETDETRHKAQGILEAITLAQGGL